jgi:hypothetical protein
MIYKVIYQTFNNKILPKLHFMEICISKTNQNLALNILNKYTLYTAMLIYV